VTDKPRDILSEMDSSADQLAQQIIDELSRAPSGRRTKRSKERALKALAEIQAMFQASGITEEELLADGRRIRRELVQEKYGIWPAP